MTTMTTVRVTAAGIAALAVLSLAACGGSGGTGTATHPPSTLPPSHAATSASAAPTRSSSASTAAANAKVIAYGLASSMVPASLGSSVAGPVMPYYIRMQVLESEANAAEGTPAVSDSVTQIPGGFQSCPPAGTTGKCQSLTGFRSDTSGRITDFLVDGQSVSTRLAIGANSTGSGLAISSVSAYLGTSTGSVWIVFRVRNVGQQTVGSVNPAFIPVLVTSDGSRFNYDTSMSVLPGPLQPGESAAVIALFHTRAITGRFSLRANGQNEQLLVSTMLHRP